MTAVSKRELNQQTARVLARVEAGESVEVTERGVARWRIEAIGTGTDAVAHLRRDGRITSPGPDPAAWPGIETSAEHTPADVDRLYAESRGPH